MNSPAIIGLRYPISMWARVPIEAMTDERSLTSIDNERVVVLFTLPKRFVRDDYAVQNPHPLAVAAEDVYCQAMEPDR